MGVPDKLTRLIKMTLTNTISKVNVAGEVSRIFSIGRGVNQGDALSCTLFNLTLERIARTVDVNLGGTLLDRSQEHLRESFGNFERESERAGLSVNEGKTKYMSMSKAINQNQRLPLNIGAYNFENVSTYKYLGSLVTENNEKAVEIKEGIKAGNVSAVSPEVPLA